MKTILYTGCVGGGTYVNLSMAAECDSSRWTQSPHTDIVKNQAVTLEPPSKIQHSTMVLSRMQLSFFCIGKSASV